MNAKCSYSKTERGPLDFQNWEGCRGTQELPRSSGKGFSCSLSQSCGFVKCGCDLLLSASPCFYPLRTCHHFHAKYHQFLDLSTRHFSASLTRITECKLVGVFKRSAHIGMLTQISCIDAQTPRSASVIFQIAREILIHTCESTKSLINVIPISFLGISFNT